MTVQVTGQVIWLKPERVTEMGDEAIELATGLQRLSHRQHITITSSVRAGFKRNFMTESSPQDGPWQQLAKMTRDERQDLGYDPWHPILRRKGDYMRSWTQIGHRFHVERVSDASALMFGNEITPSQMVMQMGPQVNVIVIDTGTRDPRATKLETGFAGADTGAADALPGMAGMHSDEYVEGFTPPRPVRFIDKRFEDRIGLNIAHMLHKMAESM